MRPRSACLSKVTRLPSLQRVAEEPGRTHKKGVEKGRKRAAVYSGFINPEQRPLAESSLGSRGGFGEKQPRFKHSWAILNMIGSL